MTPTPYLFFNGNCRDALNTYADILGGEIAALMPASDMPDGVIPGGIPDDRKDWVMHATLTIGTGKLMASDNIMGDSAQMDGCAVQIELDTAEGARAAFDQLAEGGEIQMPFAPTFWSAGFGTLRDRFGIRWMIGTSETP